MKKLFIDFIPEGTVVLNAEQSRHIAGSLRMKKGDMLTLSCQNGTDYGCMIESVSRDSVSLKVCYAQKNNSEPSVKVTLYQALAKGDKLEDVVQKCTELGVTKICPVITHRCVSRPDEKSAKKKCERYRRIALEASQQSGRGIVPEVCGITDLAKAVSEDKSDKKIIFYEMGGKSLTDIELNGCRFISIYIGPEGGFEESEVELLRSRGAEVASLGARILRTQTAGVVSLTAIMLLSGNM